LQEIDVLKSVPNVEDISKCVECSIHMASLASLQSKHASLIDELDRTKNALDEVKSRPMLLGVYETSPALQSQFDDACVRIKDLEKSFSSAKSKVPICDACPAYVDELYELKLVMRTIDDENTYLRTVLSWVSSREPQLGLMIKMFKRADGFGIGSVIEHNKFYWLYEEVGECNGEKPNERPATFITPEPSKLSGEKPNLECKPEDGSAC
jgi:hypothetical protein